MAERITYFCHRIPQTATILIGTEKDQIINTLLYYKNQRGQDVDIPSLDELPELTEININASFPLVSVDHYISAEVRENVFLHVYENAFDYVKQVAESYEKLKRGDLYKFQTIPACGLWFLPEHIMEGIREYDWEAHEPLIEAWLRNREDALDELERKGAIARAKRIPPPTMH